MWHACMHAKAQCKRVQATKEKGKIVILREDREKERER